MTAPKKANLPSMVRIGAYVHVYQHNGDEAIDGGEGHIEAVDQHGIAVREDDGLGRVSIYPWAGIWRLDIG